MTDETQTTPLASVGGGAAGSAVISPPEFAAAVPAPMLRPCDYGLSLAVVNLETQLGTIESYNRLAAAAKELRAKIDAGKAEPQNPLYATDPQGNSPLNAEVTRGADQKGDLK